MYIVACFLFQNAHKDWVFDFCWLDDEFLVSGSRDSKMALWRVVDDDIQAPDTPKYSHINPVSVKLCKGGHKIRALAFNPDYQEIAALSLNGFIHIWNAETFRQVFMHFFFVADALLKNSSLNFFHIMIPVLRRIRESSHRARRTCALLLRMGVFMELGVVHTPYFLIQELFIL